IPPISNNPHRLIKKSKHEKRGQSGPCANTVLTTRTNSVRATFSDRFSLRFFRSKKELVGLYRGFRTAFFQQVCIHIRGNRRGCVSHLFRHVNEVFPLLEFDGSKSMPERMKSDVFELRPVLFWKTVTLLITHDAFQSRLKLPLVK